MRLFLQVKALQNRMHIGVRASEHEGKPQIKYMYEKTLKKTRNLTELLRDLHCVHSPPDKNKTSGSL